jgi:(2R)-ethylmalonyl-CoA mutase
MRAFSELWDEICQERYGVEDPKLRRFRYGVQVNSLGLTEQQPENNVYRILLEMLAVTLSKSARARAVQLPAWNEALGLPRPWDQQWSLRMQQILAYETDLLEYGDIFNGSSEIAGKVEELKAQARAELAQIGDLGGAIAAVETGHMKQALVASNTARIRKIETGEQPIIGVNAYQESEPSPLSDTGSDAILTVSDNIEYEQIEQLRQWRKDRDSVAAQETIDALKSAAKEGSNIMEPSIACARAGVTTGEWGSALREIFGEYRAPTGVDVVVHLKTEDTEAVREAVAALSAKLGTPVRFLVGKPGLDGHSNGAEQIAVRAGDCGMQVRYDGIRLTPAEVVAAAIEDNVHAIGLSILSGSHVPLVRDVMNRLRTANLSHLPVIVGGIIPEEDRHVLKQLGVAAVYTPKDFHINTMMSDIVKLIDARSDDAAA